MTAWFPPDETPDVSERIARARAIILTSRQTVLLIKRIKPHNPEPYWVAPGGGMETYDYTIEDALHREVKEELGATVQIIQRAFVMAHIKKHKSLEEHFFICRLVDYDLRERFGPEFDDPARGHYLPDEIPLHPLYLEALNMKTPELRSWLAQHADILNRLSRQL